MNMGDFWGEVFTGALIGAIVGGPAGLVGVVLFTLLRPRRHCTECNAPLPKFRNNWKPLKCIWVCPECGCRIDVKGKKIEA